MINKEFEAYKLNRELKKSGVNYKFVRQSKNKFGEPSGEPIEIGSIMGLYHETNGPIALITGEATQLRTKKVPSILCLYCGIAPLDLKVGDMTLINDKTLKVTGILNIQEWNLIADISLEVVDDGNNI